MLEVLQGLIQLGFLLLVWNAHRKLDLLLTQQEETFAMVELNYDMVSTLLSIVESNLTDEQRDKFKTHGACDCHGGCKCIDAEIEEKVGLTD